MPGPKKITHILSRSRNTWALVKKSHNRLGSFPIEVCSPPPITFSAWNHGQFDFPPPGLIEFRETKIPPPFSNLHPGYNIPMSSPRGGTDSFPGFESICIYLHCEALSAFLLPLLSFFQFPLGGVVSEKKTSFRRREK